MEGVQAVVKIFRQSQVTGKIPLQVFDRREGVNNVRFDEYAELDASIAAELVVRAKSTHFAPGPPQYPQAPNYNAPQYGQPPPQHMNPQQAQNPSGPPNLANLITSMDGPALQKLLATMQQNPRTPQTPQSAQTSHTSDLASLLGNFTRQQPQQQGGYPYSSTPQQTHHPQQHQRQQSLYGAAAAAPANQAFAQNPALASILANAGNGAMQQGTGSHAQSGGQQNVQNIMEQLANLRR